VIRQHRTLAQGCAVLAAAALLTAGCSSTKSSTAGGGTTTPPTTAAVTTTSAPAGGGTQPTDAAAATTAIKTLYTTYFDSTVATSAKSALFQNATKMAPLVTALLAASKGETSHATVNSVTFTSPTLAAVSFNIFLGTAAAPVLPNANGKAVLDATSGNWEIDDVTLCTLAALAAVPAATLTASGCSS
jgi:hypothetical protein